MSRRVEWHQIATMGLAAGQYVVTVDDSGPAPVLTLEPYAPPEPPPPNMQRVTLTVPTETGPAAMFVGSEWLTVEVAG